MKTTERRLVIASLMIAGLLATGLVGRRLAESFRAAPAIGAGEESGATRGDATAITRGKRGTRVSEPTRTLIDRALDHMARMQQLARESHEILEETQAPDDTNRGNRLALDFVPTRPALGPAALVMADLEEATTLGGGTRVTRTSGGLRLDCAKGRGLSGDEGCAEDLPLIAASADGRDKAINVDRERGAEGDDSERGSNETAGSNEDSSGPAGLDGVTPATSMPMFEPSRAMPQSPTT